MSWPAYWKNWKVFDMTEITYRLPAYLIPQKCDTLVRVGRLNDGGYLINSEDISATAYLICCGVFDDWSFEECFLKLRQQSIPLVAFDPTVSLGFFWRRLRSSLTRILKPQMLIRDLKKLVSYMRFFKGPDRLHIRRWVGAPHLANSISLAEFVRDRFGDEQGFFKIDIEGSEYRLLPELIDLQPRMSGLAIEFHDCDLHLDAIEKFVRDIKLSLVHVHPNNCGGISMGGLPLVLEMTFSRGGLPRESVSSLPHDLDSDNNPVGDHYVWLSK